MKLSQSSDGQSAHSGSKVAEFVRIWLSTGISLCRRILTNSATPLALLGLAASVAPLRADERPLRVATLNTILTEIASEVGGDKVEVIGLIQPGVDPHTFEPSPADMRAVVDADLVFASGLHLESYLDRLVANVGTRGRVVAVGDALPLVLSVSKGEEDPHWWHDIDNVIFATELVRDEYVRLRPAWADSFARNAQGYRARLIALKAWVSHEIDELPPGKRQLVTSHDAFGYFAHDYGFTIHAISGLSTDSEPDARHLAALIDLIRSERIPMVFAESSVNPRLVANLVRETGVRLGGTLYADGLGFGDAATYEGMYRHNVRMIVEGLR